MPSRRITGDARHFVKAMLQSQAAASQTGIRLHLGDFELAMPESRKLALKGNHRPIAPMQYGDKDATR